MPNHSLVNSRLPPTLYKANISLIPKPGHDPNLVSSFHPISLLLIETKILGKVLTNILKEHICSIIHPDICGQEHHISLYADDILLCISHPQASIPHILTLIRNFGRLFGFSVNWDKSELMPISNKVDMTHLQSTPFKKVFKDFSYLGITVTKDPEDLLQKNWYNETEQLKQSIHFWKTISISYFSCR